MTAVKHISVFIFSVLTITFPFSAQAFCREEKTCYLKRRSGEKNMVMRMLCYAKAPSRNSFYFFLDNKPAANGLYQISKYRKTVFTPKIFSLFQKLYPGKMETDICSGNVDTWPLPVWNVTKRGITSGRSMRGWRLGDHSLQPFRTVYANYFHIK